MEEYRIFWGETHHNTYTTEPLFVAMDKVLQTAASHLDFYAAAYYTAWWPPLRTGGPLFGSEQPHSIILEEWKSQERLDREWAELQDEIGKACEPGRFVTFPGYEWQGELAVLGGRMLGCDPCWVSPGQPRNVVQEECMRML